MKIAFLHPQCRVQGGAIKMALLVTQSLQKQGHDVTLYTFDHSSECFSELQKDIHIVEWKGKKAVFFLPKKLSSIISLAWHVRHVDIIVANNPPMQIVAALAKVFSPFSKKTTIWWHHHTPWYYRPAVEVPVKEKSIRKECVLGIKSFFERHFIIPFIDQMVATSQFVSDQIMEYCGRDAQVIHPIIVDEVLSTHYQVPRKDEEIQNNITLFTHGRLEPGKGLDTIVNVWKLLNEKDPNIHLLIAGSGSLADSLRAQGAEVVQFDQFRTLESVKSGLMPVIAVYASTIDAFGMAPLEAQIAGLPTVILDRGGARETILTDMSGNPVGHLVQSEEEIFASISHFIEHKLFPKSVSIVNFFHTIEYFSPARLDRDLRMIISKKEVKKEA